MVPLWQMSEGSLSREENANLYLRGSTKGVLASPSTTCKSLRSSKSSASKDLDPTSWDIWKALLKPPWRAKKSSLGVGTGARSLVLTRDWKTTRREMRS
jgi:hypothetical protein